ncbi:MAG: Crp/Fnr family transcriptional regulator [Peptococcaceae bacterium]|nr:Crp/Fnr family transcriptional regulator [Peptococcaceae bacterium]
MTEDGQKKIFNIFEPRIMFGESNLVGFPNLLTFTCLTPVKVVAIRKQDIYNWDKQMLFTIIHILLCKLRTVGNQLTNQIFDNVEDRIENLLFELAKLYGKSHSESLTIEVPITHQVIADIVGTSRVRVSQSIAKMTREGKLSMNGKKFIIHKQ